MDLHNKSPSHPGFTQAWYFYVWILNRPAMAPSCMNFQPITSTTPDLLRLQPAIHPDMPWCPLASRDHMVIPAWPLLLVYEGRIPEHHWPMGSDSLMTINACNDQWISFFYFLVSLASIVPLSSLCRARVRSWTQCALWCTAIWPICVSAMSAHPTLCHFSSRVRCKKGSCHAGKELWGVQGYDGRPQLQMASMDAANASCHTTTSHLYECIELVVKFGFVSMQLLLCEISFASSMIKFCYCWPCSLQCAYGEVYIHYSFSNTITHACTLYTQNKLI